MNDKTSFKQSGNDTSETLALAKAFRKYSCF